ncbi:MAG TPA: crotonase/enoyl-CoA hydratase family protein [Pseudonocardiaceae bacterium]|jgi:crotonobetainyl-CoA hydratase|nr:crotonase/enoyl-CoA hydratase family protein [Pseudonocardiaceae bacterium]
MATEPAATLTRHGRVALITLNRPTALNAVNSALSDAVGDALETLATDPDLRVGVITGAGRAFSAGADLKEVSAGRSITPTEHPEWGFAGIVRHFIDKPVIAAVNGFALGGGTEIALACDLIVAGEAAKFGFPEVKRGLMAAAGGVIRTPRQIPIKLATELALTGEPIDAATALRWGLINRAVPTDEVVPAALALAETIAANAPLSVAASKRMLHRGFEFGSDLDPELWQLNDTEMRTLIRSADAAEGTMAFVEKRAPNWTGH